MNLAGAALAAALTILACACSKPPAQVVVLAGQSNAVGYGLQAADLPAGLAAADPRVRIWDGQRFAPMAPGRNTGTPRQPSTWGPEVGFAQAWRAAHPDATLHLVKYARGSTALAAGPGRDWSPGSSGELYAEASQAVRAAKAALAREGLEPQVAAILWVQGEADAGDPRAAGAYGRNLTEFLRAVRRDWAQAATPVVLAKIPRWGGQADAVRAAQDAVDAADPRTVAVDAAGLPMQPDGLHIAAAGQLQLGHALARAAEGLRP